MKYRLFLVLMCISLLTACATEAKFRKICESWIGSDSDKLLKVWGPPRAQSQLSNGDTMMDWNVINGSFSYGSMNHYSGMGFGIPLTCNVDFIVDAKTHLVKDYSYYGNHCYAK